MAFADIQSKITIKMYIIVDQLHLLFLLSVLAPSLLVLLVGIEKRSCKTRSVVAYAVLCSYFETGMVIPSNSFLLR